MSILSPMLAARYESALLCNSYDLIHNQAMLQHVNDPKF